MLLCFGVSWPFSIAKVLRTRQVGGKSPLFLCFVLTGYASGITHKLLHPPPAGASWIATNVVWFYAFNFLLVATDLVLYLKFQKPRTQGV